MIPGILITIILEKNNMRRYLITIPFQHQDDQPVIEKEKIPRLISKNLSSQHCQKYFEERHLNYKRQQ